MTNEPQREHMQLHNDVFAFHGPHTRAADTLRATLARIVLSDSHAKCLAVVSCSSNAGRSVVAANLAVLLARSGQRTVLIDAARQRAQQHLLFGIEPDFRVAQITAVPGLTVMRATDSHPSLADTLVAAPAQFAQLITDLRAEYDCIVIDTADHPDDLDAISAAGMSDGALVVVQRDGTRLQRLRKLTTELRDSASTILGTVLTDS